jgi:shikimate kinase
VIERRSGCSIRAFFDREGEEHFRDIEEASLIELTAGTAPARSCLREAGW